MPDILFVNIVIFTALGSESKAHGALFLVAFVSYVILKKEKKSEKIQIKNSPDE